MDIAQLIQTIAIYALPVLFAITVHEAAHGYAARYFGDNTAWSLGRVTLNPAKHIDPFGTILLPLMLVVIGSPIILGAAKPVPVRFGNLRNPKRDMIWVALAGPAANLVMALAWGIGLYLLQGLSVTEPFFLKMCQAGVLVNVILFAFNLFPLPPLDGGRILVGLLPIKQALLVSKIEPFGFFIVIALVFAGIVNTVWMQPVMSLTYTVLNLLLSPLAALVH
ncbi:site-2 protease family protein [Rhodoferax sp.]|uniref:site-2 protease family protein n=1 Tax=Rhodoferax sp. TaxID=50421 RepID=UPI002ACE6C05|nr:site-2 protease family protein [Rhodoferax sp.]MDZ7919342.1 site-2 protease family protein [Rhodoferax sp.]